MGKCRFVKPEIVRIDLSDGDWIEVKKRLSVGEERQAFQAIVGEVNLSGWRKPNVEMIGMAEILAYLVDWSFKDAQDKPVKISIDALKALDPDSYLELEKAIETHRSTQDAEREAAKNVRDGANESSSISPSVVG